MKTPLILIGVLVAFSVSSAVADEKTYQVTGPVLEVNSSMIAVQKGKERWEIARVSDTKVTGDVKVGDKVTVQYKMTATTIEAKPAKAEKTAASPAAKTSKK